MTRLLIILALVTLALGACSSKPPAPVEERAGRAVSYELTRDGYYRVRRGDTLHAIAFNFGLDWRDLAGWNGIRSPYLIYPDQELRLSPSGGVDGQRRASSSTVTTRPAPAPASTETRAAPPPAAGSPTTVKTGPKTKKPPASEPAVSASDPNKWLWPSEGKIVSSFKANDSTRKGIDIGGAAGQAVIASAGGQVVYSGSGLIGYGELVIIKHSDRMLSAYAHNQKRLVSEGQLVKAGSKIAEMGRNDRNQAILHFEIRVNGNPVDPRKYLPRR